MNNTKTKQPGGFYVLFLTEMWERFNFYLANSLLVLYMNKSMGFGDKAALPCVVVSTGLFKAMPYALLNQLYKSKKQRKKTDGTFTLYYLSIQAGGLLPLFLGRFSAHYFGRHATFSTTAIGMLVGCATFFREKTF